MKKIKETKRRVTAAILAAALALSLTACGNGGNAASSNDANSGSSAEDTANETAGSQENGDDAGSDAPAEENKERVTLKYATFRVGAHVMAPSEAEILRLAKEKFKDEFDIEVEEIPSDSTYIDKMKVLAASNDLPDIIEGKSGLFEIALQGNLAVPLTKYFEEDPEWRAAIGEDNIAFNTRDGEIWSAGLSGDSAVGYYYNKELFAKAGIEPAKTWDEFFSNCDKLKEAGITPLSLATGEVAYSSNLFLAAAIGTSSPEFIESNPLFADLLALQGEAEYKCYDMSFVSPSNFSSEWKTLYPELVYDRITPEEFALKLNDIAARSHE